MRARFLLPAEEEMLSAAMYYESQAPGLGRDFLEKIEAAVQDLSESPERWPVVLAQVRRRLTRRFPYGVYYRIDPDEIVILAVADLRRRPNYWIGRL